MQEYNQGEEYLEDEDLDEESLMDEAEEDTEARITQLWGIPVPKFIMIAAVILLIVIALVIFATRKSGGDSEEDSVSPEQQQELLDQLGGDTSASDAFCSEAAFGDTESAAAFGDAEATAADAFGDPEAEPAAPLTPDTLSTEDNVKLRKLGYTGDEIDLALSEGFDVEALEQAAQKLYDDEATEAIHRMSNSASEEFRYIVDMSYFGQTGYEFVSHAEEHMGDYEFEQGSYTVNADYIKCPTYGAQLQLKCRITQDMWVFYVVTPMRFAELPQEGNIVLRVNYTQYGDLTYITGVSETDPTLKTIDSSQVGNLNAVADNTDIAEESQVAEQTTTEEQSTSEDQVVEGEDQQDVNQETEN